MGSAGVSRVRGRAEFRVMSIVGGPTNVAGKNCGMCNNAELDSDISSYSYPHYYLDCFANIEQQILELMALSLIDGHKDMNHVQKP